MEQDKGLEVAQNPIALPLPLKADSDKNSEANQQWGQYTEQMRSSDPLLNLSRISREDLEDRVRALDIAYQQKAVNYSELQEYKRVIDCIGMEMRTMYTREIERGEHSGVPIELLLHRYLLRERVLTFKYTSGLWNWIKYHVLGMDMEVEKAGRG